MSSDFVGRFKKCLSKLLDEYGKLFEELAIRTEVGELTLEDRWEIFYHFAEEGKNLLKKYPAFAKLARRSAHLMPFTAEIWGIPSEEVEEN